MFESHGLNDDNVAPEPLRQWWAGLAANDVPRKLWLSQEGHVDPFDYRRAAWVDTLHRWFDHWLYGLDNGIMERAAGGPRDGADTWETHADWPLAQADARSTSTSRARPPAPKGVLSLLSGGATSSLAFTDANLSETSYESLANTQANKLHVPLAAARSTTCGSRGPRSSTSRRR